MSISLHRPVEEAKNDMALDENTRAAVVFTGFPVVPRGGRRRSRRDDYRPPYVSMHCPRRGPQRRAVAQRRRATYGPEPSSHTPPGGCGGGGPDRGDAAL